MRKSFDGLLALPTEHCQQNVSDGGLFLFVNKRRDRVKLLWWDHDGLVIWYKRLEQGTFEVPVAEEATHVTLRRTRGRSPRESSVRVSDLPHPKELTVKRPERSTRSHHNDHWPTTQLVAGR